jgi:Helix-turn-helix domain
MKRAEYEGQDRRIDAIRRHSMWSVAELAAILRRTEEAIKEMCKARTQRNSKHPLPYFKLGGRIMFMRWKIENWILKVEAAESAKHAAQASLPRGKRKRAA